MGVIYDNLGCNRFAEGLMGKDRVEMLSVTKGKVQESAGEV